MTKSNTTEDIQTRLSEIEGRRAAATPGPYRDDTDRFSSEVVTDGPNGSDIWICQLWNKSEEDFENRENNSAFLAASWTDIGYLTEVCRKLLGVEKFARDMEETVDNVRAALGLESTHYLVIADQVADVVKERDELKAEVAGLKQENERLSALAGPDAVTFVAEVLEQRNCLSQAIAESAQQAGIYNGEVDLTGPELVMLCNDMRNEILRLRKEKVEVLEKAIGAVQSISAGSPETLREVIRVLRTQQEET
jgi:hypothetical protein